MFNFYLCSYLVWLGDIAVKLRVFKIPTIFLLLPVSVLSFSVVRLCISYQLHGRTISLSIFLYEEIGFAPFLLILCMICQFCLFSTNVFKHWLTSYKEAAKIRP